ncbi:chromosome segregation protein SMC [Thalassotalea sp. M1531]|uniref:Chromosome partition protein Smc n=1 Tax=Thalassotalea algicola TaxID=2716224 RepID=A0A7Y0LBG6_9GAMM|nr:chromosome segregation protein SMC [Thalassotalea algicola]NMP31361.1 chromosome segregation protein SMC [Thalassotalea algicola]
MRLKQIKLAGFKSFVDVTKVPFPHQMTAVVGPNGCGKSNIIDAVRWVLGESSAKNLRGDAMTDVIFNGSTERKPIGQASVELFFDNQLDSINPQFSLSGSLAQRNEISIKRSVSRDGVNQYFLNGSKCRRKDITDVFLGSGLGPRSYAIIEQGMISRLIESKPQELRIFVEEAAGVSKYKERRRDTELKLKHTGENLQRLADISQEIAIHTQVLQKQAELAQRFKALKAEQRSLKVEIATLSLAKVTRAVDKLGKEQSSLVEHIEQQSEKITAKRSYLKSLDQQLNHAYDKAKNLQRDSANAEKSKSLIQHELTVTQQQFNKLESVRESAQIRKQKIQDNLTQLADEKDVLQVAFNRVTPELAALTEQIKAELKAYELALELLSEKEQSWHEKNNQLIAEKQQDIARRQQAMNKQQFLANLIAQLAEKERQLSAVEDNTDSDLSKLELQLEETRQKLNAHEIGLKELMEQQLACSQHISQITDHLVLAQGQEAKISASLNLTHQQLTHKADWHQTAERLLKDSGIEHGGSFYQHIQVEQDWQLAVKKVLGQWLNALVLDIGYSELGFASNIEQYWFINKNELTHEVTEGSLASVLGSKIGVFSWINEIKIASSVQQALAIRESSGVNQSVICIDGTFFNGAGLSKGLNEYKVDFLALARQQSQLEGERENSLLSIKNTQQQLDDTKSSLQAIEQQLVSEKEIKQTLSVNVSTLSHQIATLQLHEKNERLKKEQLTREVALLKKHINQAEENSIALSSPLLPEVYHAQEQVLERLKREIDGLKLQSAKHDAKLNGLKAQQQQLQIEQQQNSVSLSQNQLQLNHSKETFDSLEEQLSMYQQELDSLTDERQLKEQLIEIEASCCGLIEQLTMLDHDIAKIKASKEEIIIANEQLEKEFTLLENKQHKKALKKEQLIFELESFKKELNELQGSINMMLPLNVDNKNLAQHQQELIDVNAQLAQIGPVNLGAIDEYELQQQRKNKIDLQIEDLSQALATLESAIVKIDKESRSKFKATFERINLDFSTLFPKVFGGGSAYLTLTSEDVLESGVSIMARPPGKKNSTIHLLSGGEKALTALSLVFAIFRLNPAPFCMLDEVDAPLDDANVERFCNLVREMSKTVQFIYISHNKIAMEMASHLTGVTMVEPGVSRMVSVDIDEAIAMAEVS